MRKLCALIIGGILFLNVVRDAGAAFIDNAWSIRGMGQGNAFTAASDDPTVLFYNPAGIAYLEDQEMGFMYSRPFTGLDSVSVTRSYFAYAVPLRNGRGTLGLGWTDMQGQGLYREDTFLLSYGRIIPGIMGTDGSAAFGVNAKYLQHGYTLDERTVDDPVFSENSSVGAFSADAGILIHPAWQRLPGFDIGLSAKNLLPADVGLQKSETVPLETRLGGTYYWANPGKLYSASVSADAVQRDGEYSFALGGESWVTSALGIRAGLNSNDASFGLSGEFPLGNVSFRLDYTFLWPLNVEGTTGSHGVAFGIRF